jgi:two-component system sensor histidine kinase QseC
MKLSIRKFLLINLLLVLTVTTFLTVLGNYYLNHEDIKNNLDNILSQSGFLFETLGKNAIETGNTELIQKRLDSIPEKAESFLKIAENSDSSFERNQKYEFQIWDKDNHLLLRSNGAPLQTFLGKETGFTDQIINGKSWRIFTILDKEQQLNYAIAEHYEVRNHLAQRVTGDDIYIMLLTYPLSGLLIWLIIGRGLDSIQRVTNEVSQRAADNLNPVDLESTPIEIQPLVDELNRLFLRVKQAFEREQRFASDAAHELRTPLAALKTQAQVAFKTTDHIERQQHLRNVILSVDRCTHVIQQLLTLCRMSPEAIILEDHVEIDLQKLASDVIQQLAPQAVDKKIEIELITQDDHPVLLGNPTGIYAMMRNLVDNAIRYTPVGGNVKVEVLKENRNLIFRVIDSGHGIPAELRSRVFERFFRVLGTNVTGSGLGLAIVQQIVKLHNGSVKLKTPENGVGLEVEVMFETEK